MKIAKMIVRQNDIEIEGIELDPAEMSDVVKLVNAIKDLQLTIAAPLSAARPKRTD